MTIESNVHERTNWLKVIHNIDFKNMFSSNLLLRNRLKWAFPGVTMM